MRESLIDDFFKVVEKEWEQGFKKKYSLLLKEVIQLRDNNLEEFFLKKNRFVCEKFLRYILKYGKLKLKEKSSSKKILSFISLQPITSRDYDERIEALGINHAVKTYWEPEDEISKRRIDIILEAIEPREGEIIIDIGCGVGTFAYRIALKGANAVGIDYSPESIQVAKTLSEKMLDKDAKIKFIIADATGLPFENSSVDAIVSADFIEHIDDIQKEKFLDECLRVLKRHGRMIIFTPNKIRETIGSIVRLLKGGEGTRLHFGLTTRFSFENKLKKKGLTYKRKFVDIERPYLVNLPIFNELLALDILWVITK